MYPVGGGTDYNIEKAALGVLILWVAWFAFNCGSTETIDGEGKREGGREGGREEGREGEREREGGRERGRESLNKFELKQKDCECHSCSTPPSRARCSKVLHGALLMCQSIHLWTSAGGGSGFGHAVPARVAVNMILCCVSGGSLAVAIACWAQVWKREQGRAGRRK